MAAQDPTGKHPYTPPPPPPIDPPPRPVRVDLDDGRVLMITPGHVAVETFRTGRVAVETFRTGRKIITLAVTVEQARRVADALQDHEEYLEAVATRYRIRGELWFQRDMAARRRWKGGQ